MISYLGIHEIKAEHSAVHRLSHRTDEYFHGFIVNRQHCAQRPILSFFAPQGRHVAPMGEKFGKEERRPSLPPPCQISPLSLQR